MILNIMKKKLRDNFSEHFDEEELIDLKRVCNAIEVMLELLEEKFEQVKEKVDTLK